MASKLVFTFLGVGVVDENIILDGGTMSFVYKSTRSKSNQVSIGKSVANEVVNFYNAFMLDVNAKRDYTVSYTETTLTIEHTDSARLSGFDIADNNMSNITVVSTTTVNRTPIDVGVEYLQASSDYCNKVKARLTYNQTVDNLLVQQIIEGVSTTEVYNSTLNGNTVDIELDRNAFILRMVAVVDGETSERFSVSPKKMQISLAEVTENAFGGYVEIDTNNFIGDELNEYAITTDLNFINYQPSRYFSAITPGDYHGVVKDAYGCVKTETFTISNSAITAPYVPRFLSISLKNSIPFFSRTLPSGSLVANNYNFNYDEIPHPVTSTGFYPVFAKSQKTKIQVRSGYPVVKAFLHNCNGNIYQDLLEVIPLTVTKKTDNIQRNTFLEGVVSYNTWYGTLAISFGIGNTYNENGNITGQHSYNGVLPSFYQVGTSVKVQGIATQIVAIIEDEGVEYAITGISINNPQASEIIESEHIALKYEDWEFDVDMETIYSDEFRLKVTGHLTEDGNALNIWDSPIVKILPDEEFSKSKYHVLKYWSDADDRDINYSTGIKSLRNLKYNAPLLPQSIGEVETELLDNNYVKLNGEIGAVFATQLAAVPTMYGASLLKVLDTSDYLVLDNMECTTTKAAEIEHKGQLSIVSSTIGVSHIIIGGVGFASFATTSFYPVVP